MSLVGVPDPLNHSLMSAHTTESSLCRSLYPPDIFNATNVQAHNLQAPAGFIPPSCNQYQMRITEPLTQIRNASGEYNLQTSTVQTVMTATTPNASPQKQDVQPSTETTLPQVTPMSLTDCSKTNLIGDNNKTTNSAKDSSATETNSDSPKPVSHHGNVPGLIPLNNTSSLTTSASAVTTQSSIAVQATAPPKPEQELDAFPPLTSSVVKSNPPVLIPGGIMPFVQSTCSVNSTRANGLINIPTAGVLPFVPYANIQTAPNNFYPKEAALNLVSTNTSTANANTTSSQSTPPKSKSSDDYESHFLKVLGMSTATVVPDVKNDIKTQNQYSPVKSDQAVNMSQYFSNQFIKVEKDPDAHNDRKVSDNMNASSSPSFAYSGKGKQPSTIAHSSYDPNLLQMLNPSNDLPTHADAQCSTEDHKFSITYQKQHIDGLMLNDEKKHACLYCPRRFKRKDHMDRHHLIHTGETPHKCGHCGKGFKRVEKLTDHVRMHTGEKPHKCIMCGKAFRTRDKFREHSKLHAPHNPHKCIECDKTFTSGFLLQHHMYRHTGEKPHHCPICAKGFLTKDKLNRHLTTHMPSSSPKIPTPSHMPSSSNIMKMPTASHIPPSMSPMPSSPNMQKMVSSHTSISSSMPKSPIAHPLNMSAMQKTSASGMATPKMTDNLSELGSSQISKLSTSSLSIIPLTTGIPAISTTSYASPMFSNSHSLILPASSTSNLPLTSHLSVLQSHIPGISSNPAPIPLLTSNSSPATTNMPTLPTT